MSRSTRVLVLLAGIAGACSGAASDTGDSTSGATVTGAAVTGTGDGDSRQGRTHPICWT